MSQDIWTREQEFWTGGPETYRRSMDDGCLMLLPGAGILDADEVRSAIAQGPRWDAVDMLGRRTIERDGLVILAYKAVAARARHSEYRALCGSVYAHRAAGWVLIFHQQTPID